MSSGQGEAAGRIISARRVSEDQTTEVAHALSTQSQQASPQACDWVPGSYEDQERPQGDEREASRWSLAERGGQEGLLRAVWAVQAFCLTLHKWKQIQNPS